MGSKPLTPDQLINALEKWGLPYSPYTRDWKTYNRNHKGPFGPINGFTIHNFASDISDNNSLAYLHSGDAARGMPGPLSQFALDDTGKVWLIGHGRSNHGGRGDVKAFNAMVNDQLPLNEDWRPTTSGMGTTGTVDMNTHTYGVEMLYGNKGPTLAQRVNSARLAAAMMDAHGYSARSVIAHREVTLSRSDPQFMPMGGFRTAVALLLARGPGATSPVTPTQPAKPSTPAAPGPTPEEIAMSLAEVLTQITGLRSEETGRYAVTAAREGVYAGRHADLVRRLDRLTVAIEARPIGGGGEVDLAQVTEAARQGAETALMQGVNVQLTVGK